MIVPWFWGRTEGDGLNPGDSLFCAGTFAKDKASFQHLPPNICSVVAFPGEAALWPLLVPLGFGARHLGDARPGSYARDGLGVKGEEEEARGRWGPL